VIVGKSHKGDEESASEYSHSNNNNEYEELFAKRLSKLTIKNKLTFTFSKLTSI
jgi:hypothetical protein